MIYVHIGLFANYTSSLSSIFFDSGNTSSTNGHKIINSSFENMRSTGEYPAAIGIYFYGSNQKCNVTDCFFRNISSSANNALAGAIYHILYNTNNVAYYNISGNTFIEIKTNKSALVFSGSFSSLIFNYNTFYNVSSVNEGGVFKFIKYIYLFLIFREFMLVIQLQVSYLNFVVLLIVQGPKVFFFFFFFFFFLFVLFIFF
jgi:hypothetical protein